ncbi:MAG: hypothetical protein KatS3mg031_1270 [Chitinophagales bacterium]|nr:MAG: hypothetical protein KatS3mg031_1270 [Chitinophagales bacterium]
MGSSDYYHILGVSEDASTDQIKSAFRKLALRYHPDRNPGENAMEFFAAVSKAYEVLTNRQLRQLYDRKRKGISAESFSLLRRVTIRSDRVKLYVRKRMLTLEETLEAEIYVYDQLQNVFLSGIHWFHVVEGPVIRKISDSSGDHICIRYVLKPKIAGYIKVGPAGYIAGNTKFLSGTRMIKVNYPPEQIWYRPATMFERFQSALVGFLIIFYIVLIAYNIYRFNVRPYTGWPEGWEAGTYFYSRESVQSRFAEFPANIPDESRVKLSSGALQGRSPLEK